MVQASNGRVAGPPSLDRQLLQLLAGPDAPSHLRLSAIVQRLNEHSPGDTSGGATASSSQSGLHKLLLRIRSLLQPNGDVALGLRLAMEVVHSCPWDVIVQHCSEWIGAALSNFTLAVPEAISLLNGLLGSEARQRPEFWRNIGSTSATKYAMLLLETAETAVLVREKTVCLRALAEQMELQPSSFRSQAPRIQALCLRLIFEQRLCCSESISLLAKLPLTGRDNASQAELWSATLQLLLQEARSAWVGCCNTFIKTPAATSSRFSNDGIDEADDIAVLYRSHKRLAFILGEPPQPGLLGMFLSESTSFMAPVSLEEMYTLAHVILALSPSSPSQLDIPPEATMHAAQAALLPRAHACAIAFLVSLPPAHYFAQNFQTISRLCSVIERGSPALRCLAFNALMEMNMPFDPHSKILIRCSRLTLGQLARLVNRKEPDVGGDRSLAASSATTPTSSRANKKRKLHEWDHFVTLPLRGFVELDQDEYAACLAAASLVPHLYDYLSTFITPEHHDLAQTSALLLLGLVEIALKEPDELAACLISSLAGVTSLSRGSILGLITVRAASLCSQALVSPHQKTRDAAAGLNTALCDAFYPKLPPKPSLRLHFEQDLLTFKGDATKELDEVTIDEDRGVSERIAMRDVLGMEDENAQDDIIRSLLVVEKPTSAPFLPEAFAEPSSATSKPKAVNQAHLTASSGGGGRNGVAHDHLSRTSFSPDPVKPVRRPSTPRIGSPGAIARSGASSPERALPGIAATGLNRSAPSLGVLGQDRSQGNLQASSPPFGPANPSSVGRSVSSPLAKQAAHSDEPASNQQKVSNSAAAKQPVREDLGVFDDSDGSIPELDTRDSDEESLLEAD